MNLKALSLPPLIAFAACTMSPEYQRPPLPAPAAWPQGEAYEQPAASQSDSAIGWREFFRDPALQELIGLSLDNNRDLRIAALNVEAYRAQYRISRAELFPSLDAEVSRTRERSPDLTGVNPPLRTNAYAATVGIPFYELDVFGRVRSLKEAALETYLASEEARLSVQIAIVSEVALAYLAWRTDQDLLALTRSTRATYAQSLELIEASFREGVASGIDVRQARTLLEQADVQVAALVRQVAQDRNGLELLLGTAVPSRLPESLELTDTEILADLPVGLPADVLTQRPDILAAEHQLMAANADIGAARAAFFPRITITGIGGSASDELSGLFESGSRAWSFTPRINIPIFNAGRLRANLDYAEVSKDLRVAEYELAIQTAFREVADGLAARATYEEQIGAQTDLVTTTREYFELAEQRYDSGVDSYLTVLDAQRNLLASQQQLLIDRLGQIGSEVSLYRALGGGWL
jgi:outer membrane protein, multidrug efflux system